MTLGDKIKKYRMLKNLTQKDLGLKIGFSAATADSRVRKYEKDIMAPKEDIRTKLASALDIDMASISDINVQSFEDLMYIFFELEENFDVQVEKRDGKTYLAFDDSNKDMSTLITYMNLWKIQKSTCMPNQDNITDEQVHNYQVWKSKFASNIQKYFADKKNEIDECYKDAIKKASKSYKYAETTSDISILLRHIVEAGINITTCYDASYTQKNGGPGFTFSVNDLISPPSEDAKSLFTQFILELNHIAKLGISYSTRLQMNDNTLTITYTLPIPSFGIIKNQLDKFLDYYNNKELNNDVSRDLFETQFKADLNTMYNFIEKEVEHYKNYQN